MIISFDVPDAQYLDFVQSFADSYGYQETIPDPKADPDNPGGTIPSPESKETFTRRKIIGFCMEVFTVWSIKRRADQARRKQPGDDLDIK